MDKRLPILLSFAALLLTASCGDSAENIQPKTLNPSPAPTAIAHSHDWTPVSQTFSGYEMVKVPPGCFTMGKENERRDERPTSQVCIRQAFWLDKYEITNAQFGSAGAYPGDKVPRGNLTWFEARDFCMKRGGRLPTEAEWEYAARGPDDLQYPWGNDLVPANLAYDKNMTNNTPINVGSYPAGVSWVGAQDLSGNVWEWVNSMYKPYPYSVTDGREDDKDATTERVFRGGWLSYQDGGVSGYMRFKMAPDQRDWHVGFRCAVTG